MKTIKINLYEYNELNKESKEKAFNEHEIFLRSNPQTYETEDENGNIIEKYDNMDEWTQEDIKEYVEDSININEYFFFENGDLTNCTTYTGKHKKTGTTELNFNGKIYKIK